MWEYVSEVISAAMPEDNAEKDDLSGFRLVLKEMHLRKLMLLLVICGDLSIHNLMTFLLCVREGLNSNFVGFGECRSWLSIKRQRKNK